MEKEEIIPQESPTKSKKEHHHKAKSEKSIKKPADEKNEDEKGEDAAPEEPTIPKFRFTRKSNIQLPQEIKGVYDVPFSVSPEFDGMHAKAAKTDIDRSYWETEVLRLHPELKDLISRVDPVSRAATLAGLFLPSRRLLPQDGVLALICQHLRTVGLPQTANEIEESFTFNIEYPLHRPNSQLVHHLERGIASSDGFYNLLLPTPGFKNTPEQIKKQLTAQATTTLGVIGVKMLDDKKIIDEENLQDFDFSEETKLPVKGTTNQLVWAAAKRRKDLSPQMVDIFAMTYHTFMTSHTMLRKLQEAYEKLQKENSEGNLSLKDRDTNELMFVALVEKWIEISFYDFDTMLIQNLFQWINKLKFQNKGAQKRLLTAFQKQINGKEAKAIIDNFATDEVKLPKNLFTGEFSLTEMDMSELAKQIIMYAGSFYYKITAKELLDCAWSKPRIKHRAPNVVGITNHFNKLNQFVQHEILFAPTLKRRIELWTFFSQLAYKLWKLHDFFDGMAIATAFNANPVYRLKVHKQIIDPTVMSQIDIIMNDARSEKNFAQLLTLHAEALKNAGLVIPYVGVYLTQLTFFYDGNKDYIDGLVNFQKCAGIYQLVTKILSFQMKEFTYPVIDQVQEKLKDLRPWDSATLSERSMLIEPKDMTLDQLRAQLNENQ